MTVYLDWDVSNDNYNGGSGNSYANITDSSGIVFSMTSATNEMDRTIFVTVMGETYTFRSQILSGPGVRGLSFFNMSESIAVVPLPPAALGGLAMLAGLGAYRRVRR